MTPSDTGIRISVDDARDRLEAQEAVALDVVQPGAWDRIEGAVKGAVRIPPSEIGERFSELPRERDIIAYCT